MGDSTTFDALTAEPTSEKIFLAEINAAEHLLGWTLTGGQTYTYEIDYLNENITLADATTENIRKAISRIEEDSVALTAQTSIANVEANSGSYWHDTANAKLYVHPVGDDAPATHTIVGFFWLYFATKGVILNSIYYEPYIAENGIPSLSQSSPNLYWGVISTSSGWLKLLNGRGYFDQIAKKFIWMNKIAKVLVGGDDLAYTEYQTLYTFKVLATRFTRREFRLQIGSEAFNLMRSIPINRFLTSDYPNLNPSAEGKPIPYYWGSYDSTQAPLVTCVNSSYGSTGSSAQEYQFKICDHPVSTITEVHIDYGDGEGWSTIAHSNADTTAASFTIASSLFELSASKVKASFGGKHSGGVLIDKPPEVVRDLLTDTAILAYTTADYSTAAFAESTAETDFVVNVPVEKETKALSVIEQICRSDLAFFDEDEDGKMRYRTWRPYITSTLVELDDLDFLGVPEVREEGKDVFSTVSVGYNYACSMNNYSYVDQTDAESEYKYGKKESFQIDTYVRGSAQATLLGQRFRLLLKATTPKLKVSLKMPVVDHLVGDKVKMTMARAPFTNSSGYESRVFEINRKDVSCFPFVNELELFDLKAFGGEIGYWSSADVPHWSSATEEQKQTAGFWCDASGYADPTDSSSKDMSIWW